MGDFLTRIPKANIIDSFLSRLPIRLLGIPPPAFVVYGGRCCEGYSRFVDSTTTKIFAHAMDYEEYRRVRDESFSTANTAVFLDEYLPFHPDITMMGLDSPMDADSYFCALRSLFDRIENELGLDVVIAACPHSEYQLRPEIFGARRVEKFKTAELVSECRFVIAHRSTAINYAVLFRKPLILTATRSTYRHSSQTPYFDGFSIALKKPVQFFDDPIEVDLRRPYALDNSVYERYIHDYIKCDGSPEIPYWDIVCEAINKSGVANI